MLPDGILLSQFNSIVSYLKYIRGLQVRLEMLYNTFKDFNRNILHLFFSKQYSKQLFTKRVKYVLMLLRRVLHITIRIFHTIRNNEEIIIHQSNIALCEELCVGNSVSNNSND